jgi:hypothetical protein
LKLLCETFHFGILTKTPKTDKCLQEEEEEEAIRLGHSRKSIQNSDTHTRINSRSPLLTAAFKILSGEE